MARFSLGRGWGAEIWRDGMAECPQGVHRKCRKADRGLSREKTKTLNHRGHGGTQRGSTRGEPCEDTALEFSWSGAYGAAVVGVGDFPELGVGVSLADNLRVAHGNVAIDLAVNQENRDCRGCDRIFW